MSEQVALVLSYSETQLVQLVEQIIDDLVEQESRADILNYARDRLEQIKRELTEGTKL